MSTRPFHPRCEFPRGVAYPRPVDPSGQRGPTPGQARGPRFRRVGPNAYVPASIDPSVPEQRIVEVAVHLPAGGAITGWAALRMWAVAYADGRRNGRDLPVQITGATTGRRKRRGISVTYESLNRAEVALRHDVLVTLPSRALHDELRRTPDLRERVTLIDMTVAAGLVGLAEFRAYTAASSRRDAELVVEAVALARVDVRSPGESRLRLVWSLDAGLPEPGLNVPIFDRQGRFLCCGDLVDEAAGLVVEYDGAEHLKVTRRAHDRSREEECRRVGLEYTSVMAPDVRDNVAVVRRLLAARGRALFEPPERRRWTLEWPPGWQPWW